MSTKRYQEAGVDLASGQRAKERVLRAVAAARSGLAVGDLGAFGGLVRVPRDVRDPVLVMSTDGVGTKVLVSAAAHRHDTVGQDLVNHSVNDILVHGARPIAFLDYIAAAVIEPDVIASVVEGVATACRAHDMTLAGGETAEMPDLYHPGHYDLAGTIVGVVSADDAIGTDDVVANDVLVGLASDGLHTNGYTLARNILFEKMNLSVDSHIDELGESVADALLRIHRSYASILLPLTTEIHSMAHITGGGIPGNLVRALPKGLGATVDTTTWEIPPLFSLLQTSGDVAREEMFDVFNMGVGMIVVLPSSAADKVIRAAQQAGVSAWSMGVVTEGEGIQLR